MKPTCSKVMNSANQKIQEEMSESEFKLDLSQTDIDQKETGSKLRDKVRRSNFLRLYIQLITLINEYLNLY